MGEEARCKRILIADDSESSLDLLRVILYRAGFCVVEARDGEQALIKAANCRADLFIIDLNMPVLDGYAFAHAIRQTSFYQATPMLALSAAVTETDVRRIRQAGFSGFAIKPISPAKLRDRVNELLEGDLLHPRI